MNPYARLICLTLVISPALIVAQETRPPIYIWLEPEWFSGVSGGFSYWTGVAKPTGAWGIAGPGITAEFSQGGESEWNSMGAPAEETKAACERVITVPRAGKYKLWIRYVDHRGKTEPFTVRLEQNAQPAVSSELGAQPLVPPNDEYMLYWGFSFGWASLDAQLVEGPATLRLLIDKPGEAWRQVDAILLTDDPQFTPIGREKPRFAYEDSFKLQPQSANWRGTGTFGCGATMKRPQAGGKDFSMWTQIEPEPKWWAAQNLDTLSLYDVLFQFSPPADIAEQFHKQFAGRRDVPLLGWPNLHPGLYLGPTPDLSPGTPVRRWLERTKTPFYILTNYADPKYDQQTGPATYAALAGPLAPQFLGYIHGESVGTGGVGFPEKTVSTRREYVDAINAHMRKQQAEQWAAIYKTGVPETFRNKSIACLSADATAMSHAFAQQDCDLLGYEIDATNAHAPMRVAFERGAARQFGKGWINYASGNFGDACTMFTQNPVVNRGAGGWYHSKYAVTDGVPIVWYRQLYYLNYMSGASAIFWEQALGNQWILPGPGTHPIDLSPFGRATADFQGFVDRVGDRGEPYTPIAFLLSYGHAYEPVNNNCKMLGQFLEDANDRELRGLFDVAWYPAPVLSSRPITPELQSMPGGAYGNIFDVLVDRPDKAAAIKDYPIVWAAGDAEVGGAMTAAIQQYVESGGTFVVNVEAARGKLPDSLTGVKLSGQKLVLERWSPEGVAPIATTPFQVEAAQLNGAQALATGDQGAPLITRNAVGKGAVILSLIPHLLGIDERPHPALPWLMNGLTDNLLPVNVRMADGSRPTGQILYQLNRTKNGWLLMLINNRGVDKTQTGIARVDRRAVADVVLRTEQPLTAARELTQPRDLSAGRDAQSTTIKLRVHPGDVQIVQLVN